VRWTERDGVATIAAYGPVRDEVFGLRRAVALSDLSHVGVLRVSGESAFDVLDRLLPCELHLRDGQVRPTVLLHDDGTIAADLSVACDDEHYWLFAEGMPAAALAERVRAAGLPGDDLAVDDLGATHAVLGVDGPIAWELLGAFDSPGIGALPHLALARLDDGVICLRGSRTGEYGYQLVVPVTNKAAVWNRLTTLGAPLGLTLAGVEALEHCALEAGSFVVQAEGRRGVTPLDVQLQWRVSRRKTYPGSAALAAARARPDRRRSTGLRGPAGMAPGDAVVLDDVVIGTLLAAGPDYGIVGAATIGAVGATGPVGTMGAAGAVAGGGGGIALAHLDLRLAHPGIDRFTVRTADGEAPVRTVSVPFVQNRSLYLRPGRQRPDLDTLPFPYLR
jgi:aminomethyltransferase